MFGYLKPAEISEITKLNSSPIQRQMNLESFSRVNTDSCRDLNVNRHIERKGFYYTPRSLRDIGISFVKNIHFLRDSQVFKDTLVQVQTAMKKRKESNLKCNSFKARDLISEIRTESSNIVAREFFNRNLNQTVKKKNSLSIKSAIKPINPVLTKKNITNKSISVKKSPNLLKSQAEQPLVNILNKK